MSWVSKITDKVKHEVKDFFKDGGFSGKIMNKAKDFGETLSGKKAQERANEAAIEAWNMQNEYNTPANQMQRLIDAGLNPNLAYGNVNTGNASSAPDIGETGGDMIGGIGKILGYIWPVFNLVNDIHQRNQQGRAQLFQEQYQKDVLDLKRNQAAFDNALAEQRLAYSQSMSDREYEKWLKEFDERVRHNIVMEGKTSTMNMLNGLSLGLTGKGATDVVTDTARILGGLYNFGSKPQMWLFEKAIEPYYKTRAWWSIKKKK